MKIQKITMHNFRSIIHQTIDCKDFTLFVGENNSGKTNLISVLRAFYEVEGYKYDDKADFPKLAKITDSDSWVEIDFCTTEEEFKNDINDELRTWQFSFGFDINPIKSDIIIKNLIEHFIEDDNLQVGKKRVDMKNIGQGLQRHLIYTMIKLAAKYDDNKKTGEKKEFYPDFTLILFEEPEAFLHPSQQELMNIGLKQIASEYNQQVFCTSHSSVFVSKNIKNISEVKRIDKKAGESIIYQMDDKTLKDIYSDNIEINKYLQTQIDKGIPTEDEKELKKLINDKDEETKLLEEAIRFSIWLDSERSSIFFAKHILICEGATEKTFIDFLMNTEWLDLKEKHVYCLDSLGKYNIHRYINLLNRFGLSYSVLMDFDGDKKQHKYVNQFIKDKVVKVYGFEEDFETFLGIKPVPANRKDLKPLNVLKSFDDGLLAPAKISELKTIVNNLIS